MVDEIRMFPRWFYKLGEEPRLTASEEEAAALGAGWSDETTQTEAIEEESDSSPRRRR